MQIRCIEKSLNKIENSVLSEIQKWFSKGFEAVSLSLGKVYVVYAIEVRNNRNWFFIADDSFHCLEYPVAYPDCFFEVVDKRVSKLWNQSSKVDYEASSSKKISIYSFEEWDAKNIFYENLVDGDINAKLIFMRIKEFMDREFPHFEYENQAEILDDKWIQCPSCEEAWEEFSIKGMTKCPKCKLLLINPLYLKGE
ncbi:MAG: hypothetical protein PF692_07800 [Kiritimatiellae bacterium]|jgi:hypothetical protein|nr:hypothetical protein [Kiritimatiellia bacterium]